MRKWYLLFILMLTTAIVATLGGCEGEEGPPGPPGAKGLTGPDGTDPLTAAPAAHWVSIGITNGTLDGPVGAKQLYVTFDSTVSGASDTVVGNYVEYPPLLDGMDGEEAEYGTEFSKVRLSFFNPTADPDLQDPNIYEVLCRMAYDEDYIYMLLQWKEIGIAVKDEAGQDVFLVLASLSNEFNELKYSRLPDTAWNAVLDKWDTTFNYFRIDTLEEIDTIICFPNPNPPPELFCVIETSAVYDTNFFWKSSEKSINQAEDRVGVIWSAVDEPTWSDAAFDLLFRQDGYQPALPSGIDLDVWLWGAATSDPTYTADDWFINSSGSWPDAGKGPFLDNFQLPDSLPRYMNRLDPNLRTSANPAEEIYPLWYYDAVPFTTSGWATNRPVFGPGIVTVMPTLSRADVYAASTYDNTVWTLELRRARNSHSGDDLAF
ncbi:MAG: ethylbenzene dehydrogenase-related protein [bacterium]